MSHCDGTLKLDAQTTRETIAAVRDALDFMLDAIHGCSPDLARRGALALHRAATGLATLADQAEANGPLPHDVVDLAAERRTRRHRKPHAGVMV